MTVRRRDYVPALNTPLKCLTPYWEDLDSHGANSSLWNHASNTTATPARKPHR